jgi:hypothetical protein
MSAVLFECLVCFMRAHESTLVERWLVHEIQASSTGRALTLGVTETRSAKNRSPATCPCVKGQVRDAGRNLWSYFRVAIIRVVSKPRT